MAYSYIKPPMYGSKMNQSTLYNLLLAPYFYIISAAWTYSNRQAFENHVPVNDGQHLYNLADHKILDFFTMITPGTPFVVLFFGITIGMIF